MPVGSSGCQRNIDIEAFYKRIVREMLLSDEEDAISVSVLQMKDLRLRERR